MSELPPDLPRLEVLRTWLQLTLAQVDARITQLRAEQAARQRAVPAPEPDYRIQRGLDAGRSPVKVHLGDCGLARKAPGVSEATARQALVEGVAACEVCRPDAELGILDAG
ncbi:DUF6233 domain-containing protein [Streptomyces fradiae]|uniref:DksA C4-type domain-containing protein n=1 Tax=Streptomyces fradiae ATCC 10745 = DSM 40063 TaxID=1319510 RepID=A0ABQ6XKI2_STRFR|nr:DUF6233 domain-containing protein [Streptomyces fradiae]KAF0646291.1 hypothetical protein K701_29440 [Streptomyces fradiae ATCC 10745 = DSM 40063]